MLYILVAGGIIAIITLAAISEQALYSKFAFRLVKWLKEYFSL